MCKIFSSLEDSALLGLGVGFWARIADCCGESAVTYAKVCALDSPCKATILASKSCRLAAWLQNTFSAFWVKFLESIFACGAVILWALFSQILESCAESFKIVAVLESLWLALESTFLSSLRALSLGKAWQSIVSKLESTF